MIIIILVIIQQLNIILIKYKEQIIPFLNNFSRYNYRVNLNKYNYIDSGSRRIDISIIGTMTSQNETINFNQTFIICNQDDSWYIKNSILMTFLIILC